MEKEKKAGKPIERVTIEEALRDKLASLTNQANSAMQGIANISKSDVLNMILADHEDTLAANEIERLKAEHVDQVKLALWLADAAREAKQAGESVNLRELLERCESALAPAKRAERRTRKSRSTAEDAPAKEPAQSESP